jgi:hypothetical protein
MQSYDPDGVLKWTQTVTTTAINSSGWDQVDVAAAPDGRSVVVWTNAQNSNDISGRVYDPLGNPLTPEFRVNEFTTESQVSPNVSMDASGNFIVKWEERIDRYRRFDASGSPLGGDVSFNGAADVAMAPNGNYAIARSSTSSVSYELYNAAGTLLSTGILTPFSPTLTITSIPRIDMNDAGIFTVSWTENLSVGGAFARQVLPDLTWRDTTYVSDLSVGSGDTTVGMASSGRSAVLFRTSSASGLYLRSLNAFGTPESTSTLLASGSNLYASNIAMGGDGKFFTTWSIGTTVYGQFFKLGLVTAVANAGGPYAVTEGNTLTLDGRKTFGTGIPEWDLNNDGVFSDAFGVRPTVSFAQQLALGIADGPSVHQVRVRSTDSLGAYVVSGPATLTVTNTPPSITFGSFPSEVAVGGSLPLAASATDPVDAITTLDWDLDGDGIFGESGPAALWGDENVANPIYLPGG